MDRTRQSTEETQSSVVLRDSSHHSHYDRRVSRDSITSIEHMPMMQPDVPIDVAGLLHKKGRRFKTWKQRYFEIQGTNMYYFKNEKGKQLRECLGYIDLTKLYYVGKSTAASFGAAFELQTMGRVHLLAARNDSDMNEWITVIKSKMHRDAKTRAKRGSRSDINAVYDRRQQRATIKLNRNDRQSAALNEPTGGGTRTTSRLKPPSITEQEEPAPVQKEPSITSSQSFPEFSVHKVSPTPPSIGPSPSDHQISNIINTTDNDDQVMETELKQDLSPSPLVPSPLPPNSTSPDDVFPALDNLPSPDDIGQPFVFNGDLPSSPVDVALPPPLDDQLPFSTGDTNTTALPPPMESTQLPPPLPSTQLPPPLPNMQLPPPIPSTQLPPPIPSTQLPPPLPDMQLPPPIESPSLSLPLSKNEKSSAPPLNGINLLDDLPSPDEIGIPSLPNGPSSSNDPSDSSYIQKLRDLVDRDDSTWRVPYDQTHLPPMAEPWLEKNNAIDQLRSFLDVCT